MSAAASAPVPRVRAALIVVAAVTLVAAALYRVPVLRNYFSAILAVLLLYAPRALGGHEQLEHYGLTWRPIGRNLLWLGGAVALVFPLFGLGFYWWQRAGCALELLPPFGLGACSHVPSIQFPSDFLEIAAAQVLVVALPEEFFFRGFLQGVMAAAWPGRARLGIRGLGAVAAASLLFALCHFVVQGEPTTLLVFFPGLLFGWLRARTGSLTPGILFHALCNLYIEVLERSFLGLS